MGLPVSTPFSRKHFGLIGFYGGFRFAFLVHLDGYDHTVVHAFQKHLPFELNHSTFFRTLQRTNQGFVVVLSFVVIEEFAELDMRFPWFVADATNVLQKLCDFDINSVLWKERKSESKKPVIQRLQLLVKKSFRLCSCDQINRGAVVTSKSH
jgi:hypothetical protein